MLRHSMTAALLNNEFISIETCSFSRFNLMHLKKNVNLFILIRIFDVVDYWLFI